MAGCGRASGRCACRGASRARGESRETMGRWASCARRAAASHTCVRSRSPRRRHLAGCHVPPFAGLHDMRSERKNTRSTVRDRELSVRVHDCDGLSRRKAVGGRRRQFQPPHRIRSHSAQPRRQRGAGQGAGLRAPPLRSCSLRRSAVLEGLKMGLRGVVEEAHCQEARDQANPGWALWRRRASRAGPKASVTRALARPSTTR